MLTTYIKPIRTESDYEEALSRIEMLMEAEPNTPEFDELEVLTTLVEAYEAKEYRIDAPTAIAAIKFRMEQQGLNQQDLVPYIGSKSKVSEVLSGKRELSKNMIQALHKGLNIPLESLFQEPLKYRFHP
ncbi:MULTISPECIES: type II toxin-antitoxin system HigA family antitoxin [Cyanophyceae]|uniref:helix-turn-helix domain-containing protein n=1 Tax=Cyanophyceae TaxID=3028117 RepID=UPI00016DCE89|nr:MULTISPECIES: helix-turn-helix domain-containing protein [Cyanophyceae]ACB00955.1 conserved hypothetical protein with helix-turn-helix domain [Picosynechococcus sp. PCC 7002]SMH58555.1 HTH-type transcriptional regulator / antitoxin HigA [Picosynechococcus sp. OG1]SMQ86460.1 HTH-type transcriptional regulator / antitoxin HigA [Synechococcus sp. 7002]